MTPQAILALINAVLTLIERIPPLVDALKQDAEQSPEDEAKLDERISTLKNEAHWMLQ
jgi:hypothetical protein